MAEVTAKVLYISYDGILEPLGASQVVPVVAGLAKIGYPMRILSFEKPEDLQKRGEVEALRQSLGHVGVKWVVRRYHRFPSLPATAWDLLRGVATVRGLVRRPSERPALIHARGYLPALMAVFGAWRTPVRILFDMRGFWVDERIEIGRWKRKSFLVWVARRCERMLLLRSDWLVHLSRAGQQRAHRLVGDGALPPSSVIPTLVDMNRFRPAVDARASRRALGLGPEPLVVHAGTLSGWYMGEETFRWGGLLAKALGGRLVVLTRECDLARSLATREEVEALVRSVPFQEVPAWLAAADVGLALVRPTFAKQASVPTRVGEYLACGLAVVATQGVGDLEEQFAESPIAFTVSPDALPEALIGRIVEAARRQDRKEIARALAGKHFDLQRGLDAYHALYRTLGARVVP